MNKVVKILVIIIMIPVSIGIPAVLLQTISSDSQVYAQQTTLQARVEKYKADLSTTPTKADLDRLKLRCAVAQSNVKNVESHIATVQEKRTKAYEAINKSLTTLTTVLKQNSIQTTKLEAESKSFKTKTDQFNSDLKVYKQAVDDAANVNCSDDPLAFKASIEEARVYLTKLMSEVTDIRSDVNNLLKPALSDVKSDLQAQQKKSATTTGTSTSTTTNGANNGTQ